jgi:hypothetical protein
MSIDRATSGRCLRDKRLGGEQLDATEAAGSMGDEGYPQGGIIGG